MVQEIIVEVTNTTGDFILVGVIFLLTALGFYYKCHFTHNYMQLCTVWGFLFGGFGNGIFDFIAEENACSKIIQNFTTKE